ncbi:MAG: rhodanese-like domain-containing protein [Actinomycetota bacterium]
MPKTIDRTGLQELINSGAQVVDVLPEEEFQEQHIPGAINIPLKKLTRATAQEKLSRQSAVVAYCYDYQ